MSNDKNCLNCDPTFGELLDAWREERSKLVSPPSVLKRYERILERELLPALRDLPVSELRFEVTRFANSLAAGDRSPSAVGEALSLLKDIVDVAVKKGLVPLPLSISAPVRFAQRVPILNPEETARVAAAAGSTHERAFLRFMTDAGARVREILSLQWRDISMSDGKVVLCQVPQAEDPESRAQLFDSLCKSTGGHPRSVPLSRALLSLLLSMRRYPADAAVIDRSALDATDGWFREVVDRAQVPRERGLRLRDLRYTFAARLLNYGVPRVLIFKWMGWSSLAVPKLFAHVEPRATLPATFEEERALLRAALASSPSHIKPDTAR